LTQEAKQQEDYLVACVEDMRIDSGRVSGEIPWRYRRGFQELKKIKILNLDKNLLEPNKKALIIKFESHRSRENMRLCERVERG